MWKITWFSLVMERKYSNLRLVYKIRMPPKNNYVYLVLRRCASVTALHVFLERTAILTVRDKKE